MFARSIEYVWINWNFCKGYHFLNSKIYFRSQVSVNVNMNIAISYKDSFYAKVSGLEVSWRFSVLVQIYKQLIFSE